MSTKASKPFRILRKTIKKATRAALEATFKHWLKQYAPSHFERIAFRQYPNFGKNYKSSFRKGKYYKNSKAYRALAYRISKGLDTDNPLEKTGKLKDAFLHGTTRFAGSKTNLNVVWTDLPRYAYMNSTNFNKSEGLLDVTSPQYANLNKYFNSQHEKKRKLKRGSGKTYGTAVL